MPIFLLIPEPATRYASAIMTPIAILFIAYTARAKYFLTGTKRQYFNYLLCVTITFIVLSNILNTVHFRALLGSDVVAIDNVSQIAENEHNNCIVYVPTYAEQYVIVDKTSNDYSLRKDIKRIKANKKDDYNDDKLKELKQNCNKLFVVQQKSITRNTLFPPIDFSKNKNMKLIAHIVGENNSLFDQTYFVIKKTFNTRNLYNEYYLWEYVQ